MIHKKILSVILTIFMILSIIPGSVSAEPAKDERTVYIHAGGESPSETTDSSTVYMGDTANVYMAVDNPNKGEVEGGVHKEPQHDLNGYAVKIYFDPDYFDYANESSEPIDYSVPGTSVSYRMYRNIKGTETIGGKTYNTALAIYFFQGTFLPEKAADQLWYNLCRLPLAPKKTGSTEVFIDVSGKEESSIELFSKNTSEDPSKQTFKTDVMYGGRHMIVIKEKSKPQPPVADPSSGKYTETQQLKLSSESGCRIFYSVNGGSETEYIAPIEISVSSSVTCRAQRISDGQYSSYASYNYTIAPKAPSLFDSTKTLISYSHTEESAYRVWALDKNVFGTGLIDDENEVYYTFSGVSADAAKNGSDPEIGWVKVSKSNPMVEITKSRNLRLVTVNVSGEISDVSQYYLTIKPGVVSASKPSGTYGDKLDITLSCVTEGAEIYYTTDGKNPITDGRKYNGTIVLAKDATLRAVAYFDGQYGDVSSYYYIFTAHNDEGVTAFYPSGEYEGSVSVTLTPNNPENTVAYSLDGGNTWEKYTGVLMFNKDTELFVRAVDKNGTMLSVQPVLKYIIKPLPPVFAPESTQFTNADSVTVFCPESTKDNTERYELLYTTDGSDPKINGKVAPQDSDSETIKISGYTVISAVVRKDGTSYSSVVTHSYDIVTKRPVRPITTLSPGYYTREIGSTDGFETGFMPVPEHTDIYYTVTYGETAAPSPIPGIGGTVKYDGTPIAVKGKTVIKAVAVNSYGAKSDIGIFEYIVTPEAPKAAPSAVLGGGTLPIVPVSAVRGSRVKYDINGFTNEFDCETGGFWLDISSGSAYEDEAKTKPLGKQNSAEYKNAVLNISARLDGIDSLINRYTYSLSNDPSTIAPPYADKETGDYEEAAIDGDNNLLSVSLYSLNGGARILYKLDNASVWSEYDGGPLKFRKDTILQICCEKDGNLSNAVSYVYNFIPLAPVIMLPSGRYTKGEEPITTTITLDPRAPKDKDYIIYRRKNGDSQDYKYGLGTEEEINHTMSFKAFTVNSETGKSSKNTVHYYIIESDSAAGGIDVAEPYDKNRISAAVLGTGKYADGIKLFSDNKSAQIHYYYEYKKTGDDNIYKTAEKVYDNAAPIMVNSSFENIKITAWLEDANGRIGTENFTHYIDFIHLKVPQTSLGSDKTEYEKGTEYKIINDYPSDENILLYYTLDGSDPRENSERKTYDGETLHINESVTVRAVYMSVCGSCFECKNGNAEKCWYAVYGDAGTYRYTVPTERVIYTGGGGGGHRNTEPEVIDNTKKYTKDIFGNEHPTHTSYISGYPDGSVKPNGKITREETASIMSRISVRDYEKPFEVTGEVFPDVEVGRWSAADVEYMADGGVFSGYPDGEFKPSRNLTRAEFASMISRFAHLEKAAEGNPFPDIDKTHWAYDAVMKLEASGLLSGYEDGTFRPENTITRAEVMTVINKLLGRNPSEDYVKSLDYKPFSDIKDDDWYFVTVLEATVTHNYTLDEAGFEIKWEDCR